MKAFVLALAALGAVTLAACETTGASASDDPLSISLQRTPCFGRCPSYTVTIDGNGDVTYVGQRFVGVTGEQHGHASQEDIRALLRAFDDVRFESLNDSYRANITDNPSTIVTLTRNGHTKTVHDYAGTRVGMPEAVRDLQRQIDATAHTEQWVHTPSDQPAK